MSLGALDFGLLVDAAVVVVENVMRKAGEIADPRSGCVPRCGRWDDRSCTASRSSSPSTFPILSLQGTEGKMFRPMAFTVVAAILGSLDPGVDLHAGRGGAPAGPGARGRIRRASTASGTGTAVRLAWAVDRPVHVTGFAGLLFLVALVGGTRLGTEFMPRLDEGSVLVQGLRRPSTALPQGVEFSSAIEDALLDLPEVEVVVSKLGRPDLATEAMGTYESDTYVTLVPKREWRAGGKDALLTAMDSALSDIPGLDYAFTQPIQMRLDEAETGITTDVGVKIFGEDPDRLAQLAARVEREVAGVTGASEVKVTAAARVKELRIELDRLALSRYGLDAADIGHQVEMALGSSVATHVIDGPRRVGVVVRIPGGNAVDPELMGRLPVANGPAGLVTLETVARLYTEEGPEAFAHEGAQRMVVVGANIRGRDVGSFVAEASSRLVERVPLPPGYRFEWGGQYQYQQTAMRRLAVLVPVAVLGIYLLLFSNFGSIRHPVLIMLNVPFAIVGGIAALWLTGLNLSTSALIGFIAVFGIAVLNGVVMVSYMNQLRERGRAVRDAVVEGAATRLRPVLMTALAASFGFVPMATSTSPGAELQRPLATVVIGGLLSATLLTLFVLPTVYLRVERWIEARK